MIASRDIANGMPIVSEQPAMRLPRRVMDVSEADGNALLLAALSTMDSAGVQKFNELVGGTDLEKLLVNCCALNPSIDQLGVFFSFARVNHSCRPNVVNMVDGDAMTVVAQRDIKAGEEITISYFLPADDILLDKTGRQARLRERQEMFGLKGWGCCCELCTAPGAETSASDMIRLEIRERRARFMAASPIGLRDQQIQDYYSMSQLGEQDGLGTYHSMGEEGILRISQVLAMTGGKVQDSAHDMRSRGLDSGFNALAFPVGTRVVLFKLVARPELNGRSGTVVKALNKRTGRVGVVLECEGEGGASIALKLTNIMVMPPL